MPASLSMTGDTANDAAQVSPARRDGSTRTTLVLGGRAFWPAVWWADPVRAILFIVLPIFCAAAYLNRFNYWTFGASEDFITSQTFGLGLYSMALLVFGIIVGRLALTRRDMVSLIDADRAATVLARLGWITILAYVLLLGTLVTQYEVVLDLIRGDPSAGSRLRELLGRVPGVTSFIQFGVTYLALASALVTVAGFRMTTRRWVMAGTILGLTFARAVLASERLALLEGLAAIFVVPVVYRWRPSAWRGGAPFLGGVFVFVAFAAGEYLRSWQYYKGFYDSYGEFIVQRFAGYFSTSINNGSGAYLLYGEKTPTPEITSGWVTKFPGLGHYFSHGDMNMLDRYLSTYANPEFNNPGGFYSAFLDYHFAIASAFMIGVGIIIGLVHRSFQNKSLIGLVLYPSVFLGITDLIRVLYVSDTRTLPIFIGAGIVLLAIKPLTVPRDRFLAYGAAQQHQQPQHAQPVQP